MRDQMALTMASPMPVPEMAISLLASPVKLIEDEGLVGVLDALPVIFDTHQQAVVFDARR